MTPNLTPEIRPLTQDELAEVFAILRNQDAILGTRLVDCLEATLQAYRRRLEALEAVAYQARQVVAYGIHDGLGETTQWRLLVAALAAGSPARERLARVYGDKEMLGDGFKKDGTVHINDP